ncbi:la-related protein 6 [Anabrus simplex]|uniref:la-related protein 6 n=1 Tax=Anabrus simplex TaxID=316456 RepID=UPI0034DD413F
MPAPSEAVCEEVEVDQLGDLFAPPPMKHSDTRDSISSIDSDVSLTFDSHGERIASSSADDEGAHLADMSDCGSDTGSTNGKDSGCEVAEQEQEPPFVPPDDELADRIVSQVEFYFSDVNITKDAFLLKHVKRNKEGYVSLKLISSFKRVKHLAKDWRVVAHALLRSSKLQINEAGTKLRRLAPLPQYDQTTPSRTVVAMHLPHDKPTIENVAELFSSFGEIALVRIMRPGNPVPADVRSFVAKRPELVGTVCALVEYVDTESAQRAVKGQQDWRGYSQGIRVVELNTPATNSKPNPKGNSKKRTASGKKTAVSRLVDAEYSSSCATSGSEAETEHQQKQPHRPPASRYPRAAPPPPGRVVVRASTAPELCPWLQRRLSARRDSMSDSSSSGVMRPRSNSGVAHLPDNVLRLPRGPDGSRGFRERAATVC